MSTKVFDDDLNFIINSRNMRGKIKFKIVKVMKFTSKYRNNLLLLSIHFNDKC